MDVIEVICFWKDFQTSFNIDKYYTPESLAEILFQLSSESPYSHTKESYLGFCNKLISQQNTEFIPQNTYNALFLLTKKISPSEMKVRQGASERRLYKRGAHPLVTNDDAASSFPKGVSNQVIGFLSAVCIYETVEIDFITIQQNYREKGYATILFCELSKKLMQEKALGLKNIKIMLEVSEKNSHAIKLYQSLGFSLLKTRKNYYSNNEDAYIMEKLL